MILFKNAIKIIHIQTVLSSQVPKSRMCPWTQAFTELSKPSTKVKNFPRQDLAALILKNNSFLLNFKELQPGGLGFQQQRSVNHTHTNTKSHR